MDYAAIMPYLGQLAAAAASLALAVYASALGIATCLLLVAFTLGAAAHAAASNLSPIRQRLWLAAILLLPVAGPLLYLLSSRRASLPAGCEADFRLKRLPASYPRRASGQVLPGRS